MIMGGSGEQGKAATKAMVSANMAAMGAKGGPSPGEGPSREERDAGFYDVLFVGIAADRRQIRVSVSGDKDPGYGSTAKMIAEAAVCLVKEATDLPGGIWTPGAALKERLLNRLVQNSGMKFRVEY
jgi:short subunit dehydrogenase-like uncharacterized protein